MSECGNLTEVGNWPNVRFAQIAVVLIDATTLIVMCGLTIGGHPVT
jgi:hypothetical protein